MNIKTELLEGTEIPFVEPTQIEGAGRVPAPSLDAEPPELTEKMIDKAGFSRARSSLRQRYEAEAKVIERRIGGLEKARESLGLSQRKMAQLLLVDPSAWTRWTQAGCGAPPHVWRALAWYLALQDKYPALDAAFWLQGVARSADGDRISQNADEIRAARLHTRSLEIKIQDLSREIARLQQVVPVDQRAAETVDPGAKAQAETRAIANFFLALTFATLGFLVASFFMK
jgi:transcriptional regulator with XRE-family HTH domain